MAMDLFLYPFFNEHVALFRDVHLNFKAISKPRSALLGYFIRMYGSSKLMFKSQMLLFLAKLNMPTTCLHALLCQRIAVRLTNLTLAMLADSGV